MERRRLIEGSAVVPANFNGGAAFFARPSPPPRQPNYTCNKVQEALLHLASIDPIELCNEAKVEHCRATRDLRSCGRFVQSVLNSCGHASLCEECSQRCDICPICRIPLPKDGKRLRLRLYYECIEACLISKRCDDRLQDKEDDEKEIIADVQRLYSLFDVSLENNLNSLICHYITDVCMDESAVSSDPVTAFLLDEVVIKDWCKRTYKNILAELQGLYSLAIEDIKENLDHLLKYSAKLAGLVNVLDVLESSFKGSLSAKLHDLYHLQESILRTKQHMEVMTWCSRNQFLENVKSSHVNMNAWRSSFRERKSASVKRAWPASVIHQATESYKPNTSTLFVEDALSNLDGEMAKIDDNEEQLEIMLMQKDGVTYRRYKIEGLAGLYPFENLRAATDAIFLLGSSDMVIAKQAIFLYYLFDRHWGVPEERWKYIVDDFAATFSIARHSLLESFAFYLLDDHTEGALKEACHLLPEISGPTLHPKVAQVLLERQNPDAALMVLRWSGRDEPRYVLLEEAVTSVRVQVECGLITEAFMYQRAVCSKVKENKTKDISFENDLAGVRDESWTWSSWVEALVTEMCCLCLRRSLIDRMIELPWNLDEEKHIRKCLLDFAADDPLSTVGSLLVVFYLQRYRYSEAYEVDRQLQSMEQDFISKNSVSEEMESRMKSISYWRAGLVDKSIELLPPVEQQQLQNGKLSGTLSLTRKEISVTEKSDIHKAREPIFTSLLVPPVSYLTAPGNEMDNGISSMRTSAFDSASKSGGFSTFSSSYKGYGASNSTNFFSDVENGPMVVSNFRKRFNFDDSVASSRRTSPTTSSPVRHMNGSSLRDQKIPIQNGSAKRAAVNPATPLRSNLGYPDFSQDLSVQSKLPLPGTGGATWLSAPDDSMDISWSDDKKGLSVEESKPNGGPRWRSDDASDDEEYQSPATQTGTVTYKRNVRRGGRGRLLMR